MTIVVLTGGARGDTQPYAALALGFRSAGEKRGHDTEQVPNRVKFISASPQFRPRI
jgi:hypothetical protein